MLADGQPELGEMGRICDGIPAGIAQPAGLPSDGTHCEIIGPPMPGLSGGGNFAEFLRGAGLPIFDPCEPKLVPGSEALPVLFQKISTASSLAECGIHLAWGLRTGLCSLDPECAEPSRAAVRNRTGGLFPLPVCLPCESLLQHIPLGAAEMKALAVDCWLGVACAAINKLYGCRPAVSDRRPGKTHRAALGALRDKIDRFLSGEAPKTTLLFSQVIEEIKERKVSYSGEEIAQPFPISEEQIKKGLPPLGHGGSVPLLPFVRGRTRFLLENPEENLIPIEEREITPVQAKVHVRKGEELKVFELLKSRGIIDWVPHDVPYKTPRGPLLNGLFGVVKPGRFTVDHQPILRVIMNLVPANGLLRVICGDISSLPHATAWLPLVVEDGCELFMSQGDMSSAFYLFSIPACWKPYMCFNYAARGEEIGLQPGGVFHPCCIVLPMGWNSSVGIMQMISREVLLCQGLPPSLELRKGNSLPPWFTLAVTRSSSTTAWWQVYLDNFMSAELTREEKADINPTLQAAAMRAWSDVGILTAEDKQVLNSHCVVELGVRLDGLWGLLGASPKRVLKTLWASVHLLASERWDKKLAQIILGRWIFILQFRRAAMGTLSRSWETIEAKWPRPQQVRRLKGEVLALMCLAPLLQADLRMPYDEVVTCSDASELAGACAISAGLTWSGRSLVNFLADQRLHPISRPILLISIFNGMGGAFRCYDILGIAVSGRISVDISKPANRVTRSTWPDVIEYHDITGITRDDVRAWANSFPRIAEVHVMAGFPCVHLSSVRAFRENLSGDGSRLFWDLLTLLAWIHDIFGSYCKVKHCIENVASMDEPARKQISAELDIVPVKLDPADAMPFSRPRLAWCTEELFGMEGVALFTEKDYVRAYVTGPMPPVASWIRPGWSWPASGSDIRFPTFMKAIKRERPPPQPAGWHRATASSLEMWEQHSYRFPPYQYADSFRLCHADQPQRLLDASEREILMGFGPQHTATCMSASEAKASRTRFEDTRLSLIGDSFAMISFTVMAAQMCADLVPRMRPEQILLRLGLAPGASAHPCVQVPMSRWLQYGGDADDHGEEALQLVRHLGLTVNHTGADVKLTTGQIMGSKNPGHSSVRAFWWQWTHLFKVRWTTHVHINYQEMKMILQTLLWKARNPLNINKRWLHLEDSMVCLYILTKGRTSSKLLQPLANKIGALQLGLGVCVLHAHVPSAENPTDAASRK